MRKPRTFREDANLTTKSGKPVWITHQCQLTKRYHGVYLNRNNVWVSTSWDKDGMWQKFNSSMDLSLEE